MMYLGDQAVGLATSLPIFGDIAKIECGEYTPTTDMTSNDRWFNHSLGVIPDFILVFTSGMSGSATASNTYLVNFLVTKHDFVNASSNGNCFKSMTKLNATTLSLTARMSAMSNVATTSQFMMNIPNGTELFQANVTYYYIIGKFKEVTSNAS